MTARIAKALYPDADIREQPFEKSKLTDESYDLAISNVPFGARALARRLTVVMTYVINLGVPPLLFAQVLYGRALYTSSVLIGAYWISIILLLTLTYWLLYQFSRTA